MRTCGHFIKVEGDDLEIPTASAMPLGFVVNELITNAVKYGKGQIVVRIGTSCSLLNFLAFQPFNFGTGRWAGLAGGFRPRQ